MQVIRNIPVPAKRSSISRSSKLYTVIRISKDFLLQKSVVGLTGNF